MPILGVTEVATRGTLTVSPVLGTEPFAVRTFGVQVPAGGPQVNVQATDVAVATTLPQIAPPTVTSIIAGISVPVILSEFPVKLLTVIASTGEV